MCTYVEFMYHKRNITTAVHLKVKTQSNRKILNCLVQKLVNDLYLGLMFERPIFSAPAL